MTNKVIEIKTVYHSQQCNLFLVDKPSWSPPHVSFLFQIKYTSKTLLMIYLDY